MSSYNIVEKIKYSQNPQEAVALREYIVFEDKESEKKYIMCKFVNNVNQRLYGMKFEVMQYDESGDIVARSVALYHDFSANANETFVPNAKLNISYRCKTISFRLLYAYFDRVKFEDGKLVDNAYEFDRYVSDVGLITSPDNKMPVENFYPDSNDDKPSKREKHNKHEKPFYVKNITKRNIAKFPVVFNVLVMLAVFAFAITSLIMFTKTSKQFSIQNFNVKILSRQEKTVGIEGYEGGDSNLIIPSEIGGYKVVRIESGAFRKSSITMLKIDSPSLSIDSNAFTDCKSLKSIIANDGRISVSGNAFKNCSALNGIYMPNATIAAGSFTGSLAVTEMDIAGCTATSMGQVFGAGAENMNLNLSMNISKITFEFFSDIGIGSLNIKNSDCEVEFGALENLQLKGYEKFDNVELIDGAVISVSVADGKLVLPSSVKKFDVTRFSGKIAEVEHLTLLTRNLDLGAVFFEAFPNLQTLEIADKTIVRDDETLRYCTARKLVTPLLGNKLYDYLKNSTIDSVEITSSKASSGMSVPDGYFAGLALKGIIINPDVEISQGAFEGIESIDVLSIPGLDGGSRLADYYHNFSEIKIGKLILTPLELIKSIYTGMFYNLPKVKEIEIANGFDICGPFIIDNTSYGVEKITFGEGITFNYPVIGDGCNSLTEVTANLDTTRPYFEFNRSCSATKVLNVTSKQTVNSIFLIGCDNLTALRLSAPYVSDGVLAPCNNLTYLELKTDTLSSKLADLFAGTRVRLSQLVLDVSEIPSGYFRDAQYDGAEFTQLYLLSINKLNADVLYGLNIDLLFVSDTIAYDSDLVDVLNNVNVKTLLFEGKRDGLDGLKEVNSVGYEVTDISYLLQHFHS